MDIITHENINEYIWNTTVKDFDKSNYLEVFILKDFEVRRKGAGSGIRGSQQSDELAKLYRNQSAIRAGSRIRELVKQNHLKYMWTLTYAEEITDTEQVKADFKKLKANLKNRLGENIKYVAVIEVQEERSKKAGKNILHLHFATDKRIDINKVDESWKRGFVFVSEFSGDIEKVAGYLGKYIKKGIDSTAIRSKEQKRYLTSRGLDKPLRVNLITSPKEYMRMVKDAEYIKEFEQGVWLKLNKRRMSKAISEAIEKAVKTQDKIKKQAM